MRRDSIACLKPDHCRGSLGSSHFNWGQVLRTEVSARSTDGKELLLPGRRENSGVTDRCRNEALHLPDSFNPSTESRDLILFYQSVATLEVTPEVRNTRTIWAVHPARTGRVYG